MTTDVDERQLEIIRLRERVAHLERELIEVQRWANEVVADAQERTYWLDRWHLDLGRVMDRPAAERARGAMRAVRSVFRFVRRLKRRLLP